MNLNTEQYFSTVPEIQAPRSVFDRSFTYKTTFNANKLIPIFCDEALPGDSMKLDFTAFGRLLNPLVVPIMDELYFETLWFKVPNRLVWNHWVNFCGEQDNPNDSIDYVIPTVNSGDNGFAVGSIFDMFGLPVNVANLEVNSLPLRCYNLIYNTWFRDENLINSEPVELGDSDDVSNYKLLNSAKMHDYFTSMLPFAQKFGSVPLPLYGTADVISNGDLSFTSGRGTSFDGARLFISAQSLSGTSIGSNTSQNRVVQLSTNSNPSSPEPLQYKSGLGIDLSSTTGATISDFRFAIKLQQFRERQALSGTRYIEFVKAMFNTDMGDYRAYRPEFLGSTREMIDINTVVQTSATSSASPQGNLTAYGVVANHGSGFSTSFVEHGYLIGLCRIRHNPVYQQGVNKMWLRSTLLDFYNPCFNGISEQPVLNAELVAQGGNVLASDGEPVDSKALGFQEAWAEYRYKPSMITGQLRSGITQSLDIYHLAQYFTDSNGNPSVPLLNQSFIEENIPLDRVLAINTGENIPQFVFDFRFSYVCARPMPVRNIPAGLYDRF